jgi:peptidoglycan-N-acetylglucosamine deacetylase
LSPDARKIIFFLGRLPTTVLDCARTFLYSKRDRVASSVMISFDDGPCPQSTPYILDELRAIKNREGLPLKAGFFLIGKDKSGSRRFDIWSDRRRSKVPSGSLALRCPWPVPSAEAYPEIVRAIEEAGHYAMVHSQRHRDFATCRIEEIEAEIMGCHETLVAAGAKPHRYFRPPYLSMPKIEPDSRLIREGWRLVTGVGSGDTHPWATEGSVINCCMRRTKRHHGPVVLIFHDFRGLTAYRLSIGRIVGGLIRAGYLIEDFDPEVLSKPLSIQGSAGG